MDFEQYKHTENKIREAAQNHSVDFDEQAWAKMEKLLDKKPRNRPFVPWWTLPVILLMGLAAGLIISRNWHSGGKANLITNIQPKERTQDPSTYQEKTSSNQHPQVSANEPVSAENVKLSGENLPMISGENTGASDVDELFHFNKRVTGRQHAKMVITIIHAVPGIDPPTDRILEDRITQLSFNEITHSPDSTEIKKGKIAEPNRDSTVDKQKKSGRRDRNRAISKFYIKGAIGIDYASLSLLSFNNSKSRGRFGLELGYQFNQRFGIESGIYVSRKVYQAGPNDYNSKSTDYWRSVKLLQVNANCLVYDIPVSVRYNIVQNRKVDVYSSLGLSSYIMKTEDYHYDYLRGYNYSEYNKRYTGNSNFASTLNLSLGMERKLSGSFSLQLEPYVSIPLKGVGDGRVKLYSAGLNAAIRYFPFKKK